MAKVIIKGDITLSRRDLGLLRQSTAENALTTLRMAGASVTVDVITRTSSKKVKSKVAIPPSGEGGTLPIEEPQS